MLQFVLLIIFQLVFELTKSGTVSLFFSGKADIIKRQVESVDKSFTGRSTVIQRVHSLLDKGGDEII
ncbi:MAG: hypothetical protein ACTSUN_05460 [Promethearchaeota archaeon]